MITGAGGLLGKAATERFSRDCEILAPGHSQLDITDAAAVGEAVTNFSPNLILNCAAMARVDACESEQALAHAVNTVAPGLLAAAAHENNSDIVHISTDYVFDGEKRSPYTIEDEPRPISAYGNSKLAGELAVMAATDRYYIARVARLFGLGGSNFGSRIFQILKQASDKVKVFTYPVSQATYLPDLVDRLRELAESREYGIYHLTGSGPIVSWYEFATFAAEMMGLNEELLETVEYEDLGLPARRPAYSALRCLKSEQLGLPSMRDWREGLAEMYKRF
jgi:dTDP-4-dehydrorhamnose reductase